MLLGGMTAEQLQSNLGTPDPIVSTEGGDGSMILAGMEEMLTATEEGKKCCGN